ncbi:hypothetical protein [Rhodoferax aquaticus]|uniref:Uncharacterized protein n=1 Tax=Rhodoferax aquaticus TaxID=2527691 RepID=A0A515ER83_9BURK|nr:hypothetical protein [Rhodoferax aquaticus]QDL55150.1 hypothetical protein EXZ61_13795 [Rhodoferax aquaticus]
MQTPIAFTPLRPQTFRHRPSATPGNFGTEHDETEAAPVLRCSVMAWPASWRVAAVMPALLVLWLGVAWALLEVAPL